ncbi:MAG TPA: vWA domain-containing protein [Trebonia sp.]|nr:vWA domain-containing protein [Trebonia sp.]
MPVTWIRRSFTAAGLTQIPPGPHLRAVQDRFGGTVMLCIDVSGSMSGLPLAEAVRGARQFVAEAVTAHYRIGIVLWDDGVAAVAEPAFDGMAATGVLDTARIRGGTNLLPGLTRCHEVLDGFTGDRVVALFGDGDLGPQRAEVLTRVAQMKAENIRFVTRGLGPYAARVFGEISDEDTSSATIADVSDLADGIADMATTLKHRGLARPR